MEKKQKQSKKSNLEIRREMASAVLPKVRQLVKEYDLPAVQAAVKMLYENRRAEKELAEAEAKAAELRKKLEV